MAYRDFVRWVSVGSEPGDSPCRVTVEMPKGALPHDVRDLLVDALVEGALPQQVPPDGAVEEARRRLRRDVVTAIKIADGDLGATDDYEWRGFYNPDNRPSWWPKPRWWAAMAETDGR